MTDVELWRDQQAIEELAARFVQNTTEQRRANHTKAAYASDWRRWQVWLAETGTPMPETQAAAVVALAQYLQANNQLAASTLRRRLAGIRSGMLDRDLPWPEFPAGRDALQQYVDVIARDQARGHTASPAITERLLQQMLATCARTPNGKRARAVLTIGFLGALRRSEIVGLNLADVDLADEGMILQIRRSKTDHTGVGRRVWIPLTKHPENCASRAVEAWLEARGNQPGPLFVSHRKGRPNPPEERFRMEADVVNRIVQERAAATGDRRHYTAHSLRSGLITQAKKNGADAHDIKRQSGHKSLDMLEHYIQDNRGFDDNVVRLLNL